MKVRAVPCFTTLLALFVFAICLPDAQAVVYVKADSPGPTLDGNSWETAYHSVQVAADDAAVTGEEVWVAKGRYLGKTNLQAGVSLYGGFAGTETSRDQRPSFPRPNQYLGDTETDPNETVLVVEGGTVLVGLSTSPATSVVDGFTLTCTYAHGGGNGIEANTSPMIIRNNKFIANTVAGVHCGIGAHLVENNFFRGDLNHGGGAGVGISNSSTTVRGNIFTRCSALTASVIAVYSSSGAVITDNELIDNGLYTVGVSGTPGPAITLVNASPLISGNTFTGNKGGINCTSGSSPMISDSIFTGNQGPVISNDSLSSPVIIRNTFRGNVGEYDDECIVLKGSARLERNEIIGNYSGVACSGNAVVSNNIIAANSGWDCTAVRCCESAVVTNNTIVGNFASVDETGVIGVINCTYGTPTIANNVVAFNSSGVQRYTIDEGNAPILRNNCVHGNTAYDYLYVSAGEGDISADPKLAGWQYGSLHLLLDSPCINAGWPEAPGLTSTDIDDEPRVQGGCVDIGADESDGVTAWPAGPPAVVRVSPDGDDDYDGSTWALAKRTVTSAIEQASSPGGEVWVKAGSYAEGLKLPAFVHLYGGFAGTEGSRSARNWSANESILSGFTAYYGTTISIEYTGVRGTSTVDGFTIYPSYSGIYCKQASTLIANNKILGCADFGILAEEGSLDIRNNVVAEGGPTGWAYGPLHFDGGSHTITGNTISDNCGTMDPGSIVLYDCYTATVSGNIIERNETSGAGGIYCERSSVEITDNLIRDNTGIGLGGIYFYLPDNYDYTGNMQCLITGNAITGNRFEAGSHSAGGIYCEGDCDIAITGNTIADNDGLGLQITLAYPWTVREQGPVMISNNLIAYNAMGLSADPSHELHNNCVYGNALYNYHSSVAPGVADISADPLFADRANGDYHLSTMSPCVNAGWNGAPNLPAKDMDGEARIQGGTVDIGADECWLAATGVREAKRSANGILVSFTDAVVTAAFDGFFYIEAEDRSSGVRVEKADHGAEAGDRVDVTGSLKTNADGERYVEATALVEDGSGSVKPLSMNALLIGGGDWWYNPAIGAGQQGVVDGTCLNNIGMLVQTWGRLSYSDGTYTLSAGIGRPGVKVLLGGLSVSGMNPFVKITGISSCYRDTDGLHTLLLATGVTLVE